VWFDAFGSMAWYWCPMFAPSEVFTSRSELNISSVVVLAVCGCCFKPTVFGVFGEGASGDFVLVSVGGCFLVVFEVGCWEVGDFEFGDFELDDFEVDDFESDDFETDDFETDDFESDDFEPTDFKPVDFESDDFEPDFGVSNFESDFFEFISRLF